MSIIKSSTVAASDFELGYEEMVERNYPVTVADFVADAGGDSARLQWRSASGRNWDEWVNGDIWGLNLVIKDAKLAKRIFNSSQHLRSQRD